MAGTATRFDVAKIPMGVIATVWTGLANPSAGARLTLDADGTPDATANPSAKNLGHTDAGLSISATESTSDFFADESFGPIGSYIESVEFTISGTALQVADEEVIKVLGANFATYSTSSGYKQNTLGVKSSISYTSVAVIWPSPMDATKYEVFHLYNARNIAGFKFSIGRKQRAGTEFNFKGYGLTARAAADQFGNYWWQI